MKAFLVVILCLPFVLAKEPTKKDKRGLYAESLGYSSLLNSEWAGEQANPWAEEVVAPRTLSYSAPISFDSAPLPLAHSYNFEPLHSLPVAAPLQVEHSLPVAHHSAPVLRYVSLPSTVTVVRKSVHKHSFPLVEPVPVVRSLPVAEEWQVAQPLPVARSVYPGLRSAQTVW